MRIALLLFPVVLSFAVLGAHFLRSRSWILVLLCLACLGLLALRRNWAMRAAQAGLALGSLEWIRTLAELVTERADAGQPYLRLTVILGIVIAVTAGSGLVFRHPALRGWFGRAPGEPGPQ